MRNIVQPHRYVNLAIIQAAYRKLRRERERDALRDYLLPPASIFVLVSGALKAGLSDEWLATTTVRERAGLFSQIATARLSGVRP